MKRSVFIFLALVSILFSSCSKEETKPIVSKSEDGKLTITVSGSRYTSLDPYMVDIVAEIDGVELPAQVEAQCDQLTEEEVKFEWKDNRYCTVTITQRDGAVLPVPVSIIK